MQEEEIQRPIAWPCISVPAERLLWKDRPSYFLLTEQDRMIVKETLRFTAERMEEYRAVATIDVEHDRADKEASRRNDCPMLHLWAESSPFGTLYASDGGPLGIWRQWAPHAQGQAMKGGHFFPEENPDDTVLLSNGSCPCSPVLARRRGPCFPAQRRIGKFGLREEPSSMR